MTTTVNLITVDDDNETYSNVSKPVFQFRNICLMSMFIYVSCQEVVYNK